MRFALAPALAAAAVLLAGCSESTPVNDDGETVAQPSEVDIPEFEYSREPNREPIGVTDEAGCNAGLARPFVGQEATSETRGELLSAVAPLVTVRWLSPDETENDEVNPRRLTISLDEEGVIQTVRCG